MNYIIDVKTLGILNGENNSRWQTETLRDEYYRSMNPPPPREKAVCKTPELQAIHDNKNLTRDEKIAAAKVLLNAATVTAASVTAANKTSDISRIRRAVATLANKINRKLKNLSASFKKAWEVIKGKTILSKVNGVSFGRTQTALQHLLRYEPQDIVVELIREPDNAHDENAVGIHVSAKGSKTYQIGFLPRDLAQYIAKLIDKGIKLTATFKGVTGGTEYFHNFGALIELKI